MGIYGPRTVYVIALKDAPGCHEFLLQDDGKWLHVKETTEIGETPTPTCLREMSVGTWVMRILTVLLIAYIQHLVPHIWSMRLR